MVPNLVTPTQTFSFIFIYFNSSFRCLLVCVSGNMKKRGHAVAGISFSFRFINFYYLVADIDIVCAWPICCMLWPIWFVADIVVSPYESAKQIPGAKFSVVSSALFNDCFICFTLSFRQWRKLVEKSGGSASTNGRVAASS